MSENETEETTDAELADNVDRTISAIADMVQEHHEGTNPIGIEPEELIGYAQPQIRQWVFHHPESAKTAIATVHLATRDLLENHAEKDPEELV